MRRRKDVNFNHWLFYQKLGAHAETTKQGKKTARRLDTRTVLQELKEAALLHGGLVVADSDLNNSSRFWGLTQGTHEERKLFREAFECGFIRRAVRQRNGAPLSQQEIFAQFKANNAELASEVPSDHAMELDRILNRIERTWSPFHLDMGRLAPLFRDRLIVGLGTAPWSQLKDSSYVKTLNSISHNIIDHLTDYHLQDASSLRGAILMREFLTVRENDSVRTKRAKEHLAHLLEAAYNGNVPAALDDEVLLRMSDNQSIPAGPGDSRANEVLNVESDSLELKIEVQRYTRQFKINEEVLNQLSFSEIAKLREPAEKPGALFDIQFQALSSPWDLERYRSGLDEAAQAYFEFLATNSAALLPLQGVDVDKVADKLIIRSKVREAERDFDFVILLAALDLVALFSEHRYVAIPITFLLVGEPYLHLMRRLLAILQARTLSGPLAAQTEELRRSLKGIDRAGRRIETIGRPDYRAFLRAREELLQGRPLTQV